MEDEINEYNGVYNGKWHIISPEGFDLPEGKEYIKNKIDEEIVIIGNKIDLDEFVNGVKNIMNETLIEINVEIINCPRKNFGDTFRNFEYLDLTIHGCLLTFKDIKDIVESSRDECVHYLDLSGNTFDNGHKDWNLIKYIKKVLSRNRIDPSIRKSNLKDCNFNAEEKNKLKEELGFENFLLI